MINEDEDRIVHGGELEYGSLEEVAVEAPQVILPKGVLQHDESYISYIIRELREEGINVPNLKFHETIGCTIYIKNGFKIGSPDSPKYVTLMRGASIDKLHFLFPDFKTNKKYAEELLKQISWFETISIHGGENDSSSFPCIDFSFKPWDSDLPPDNQGNRWGQNYLGYNECNDWFFSKYSTIITQKISNPAEILDDIARYIKENGVAG